MKSIFPDQFSALRSAMTAFAVFSRASRESPFRAQLIFVCTSRNFAPPSAESFSLSLFAVTGAQLPLSAKANVLFFRLWEIS